MIGTDQLLQRLVLFLQSLQLRLEVLSTRRQVDEDFNLTNSLARIWLQCIADGPLSGVSSSSYSGL